MTTDEGFTKPRYRTNVSRYLLGITDTLEEILELPACVNTIINIVEILIKVRVEQGTVYICGNGGSAATASHFACDLAKGTILKDDRLCAIALTDNVPLITAWANDGSYADIFTEQLKNYHITKKDIVIGISASGSSWNVLDAIGYANGIGLITIGITGMDGGLLKEKARVLLLIPSEDMQHIEDIHLILCHLIARLVAGDQK